MKSSHLIKNKSQIYSIINVGSGIPMVDINEEHDEDADSSDGNI